MSAPVQRHRNAVLWPRGQTDQRFDGCVTVHLQAKPLGCHGDNKHRLHQRKVIAQTYSGTTPKRDIGIGVLRPLGVFFKRIQPTLVSSKKSPEQHSLESISLRLSRIESLLTKDSDDSEVE